MKSIGLDRYDASHGPHPEEVTRSLRQARSRASSTRYGVTVSKDGHRHDFACGRPSRRRALKKRAPPQDEVGGCGISQELDLMVRSAAKPRVSNHGRRRECIVARDDGERNWIVS